MMELLRQEISTLIEKLEKSSPFFNSAEDTALRLLQKIYVTAQRVFQASQLNRPFAELNQFWLESVPWCSPLSKDIERLLIIQEELVEQERDITRTRP